MTSCKFWGLWLLELMLCTSIVGTPCPCEPSMKWPYLVHQCLQVWAGCLLYKAPGLEQLHHILTLEACTQQVACGNLHWPGYWTSVEMLGQQQSALQASDVVHGRFWLRADAETICCELSYLLAMLYCCTCCLRRQLAAFLWPLLLGSVTAMSGAPGMATETGNGQHHAS